MVYLQAGSVNGLQAAIQQAGPWGKVIVKSGLHKEDLTVRVTHPIRILGEPGAIIQSGVSPDLSGNFPSTSFAALQVENANFVIIQKLQFIPDPAIGTGPNAIVLYESDYSLIRNNSFDSFDGAVLLVESSFCTISQNDANGPLSEGGYGNGLFNSASSDANIFFNNTLVDFGNGMFVCDRNGLVFRNQVDSSFYGYIYCTWPLGFIQLDNGVDIGTTTSATGYLGLSNESHNSILDGYLIVDGANKNNIVNNFASNSGEYDVFFTGDFIDEGFFRPKSFENNFLAGRFRNIQVKDCGDNNNIFGGQLVDTNLDPCP